MYYVYRRSTSRLVTKIVPGAEILLTMFDKDIYEVIIY